MTKLVVFATNSKKSESNFGFILPRNIPGENSKNISNHQRSDENDLIVPKVTGVTK